jgi:DNA polymerase V
MGDIARCSLGREGEFHNEDLLYKLFGVNAELLIDHAWGYEPCTIADIKAYKPSTNSICSGQVLHCPYDCAKAKLIVREMTDLLVLDLVDKGLVTDQMVLTIGYDRENLSDPEAVKAYKGTIVTDHYGRRIPKHSHGTANLHRKTSSTRLITDAVMKLFDEIIDPTLLVRRINLTAAHVIPEYLVQPETQMFQLDLFADQLDTAEEETLAREKSRQKAVLHIQKKYGKNAIVKGMNLQEGATTMDRNRQIGGHKA